MLQNYEVDQSGQVPLSGLRLHLAAVSAAGAMQTTRGLDRTQPDGAMAIDLPETSGRRIEARLHSERDGGSIEVVEFKGEKAVRSAALRGLYLVAGSPTDLAGTIGFTAPKSGATGRLRRGKPAESLAEQANAQGILLFANLEQALHKAARR